jgi:Tol biopolymer transport system component
MERDLRRRFGDIHDLRLDIDDALEQPDTRPLDQPVVNRWSRSAWIVGAVAAIAAAALVAALWSRSFAEASATAPEMRVDVTTPPTTDPVSLAISPDGHDLVFVASADGKSQLWLRSLAVEDSRPLQGTEGARYPFWSPDSRSIAFFADQKLKRLDLDGGAIQTIATAIAGQGGAWNRDDVIVFAPSGGSALSRVSAKGGQATVVTQHTVGPGHRFPRFLPDGEHFLFYAKDSQSEYVGSVRGLPQQQLLTTDGAAVYVSTGHILFARQDKLFAQRFDAVGLQLADSPFLVSDQVMVDAFANLPALSSSDGGAVAYRRGSTTSAVRQLVWVDRSGRLIAPFADPDTSAGVDPVLSADGRRVALWRNVDGNPDVWVFDADGRRSRVTTASSADMFPVWSPDARRIVFGSNRTGAGMDLYTRSANGDGEQLLIAASPGFASPLDWSQDGRFILYGTGPAGRAQDIWAVAVNGDRRPIPVAHTEFTERLGQFSPDGKWVAFQSDESGQFEIYAQPFPGPGARMLVSAGGGTQPRWRPDGKELFYIAPDGRLVATPIRGTADTTLATGSPAVLFVATIGATQPQSRQQYAVSADGQRFLLNTLKEGTSTTPITLLLNWNRGRK